MKRNQGKAMVSRSFIAILSFAGKDASRPPAFVRLIQPSWRGSETTGLPAAGAAFRPQGVERVNRSMRRKRQRTAASMEVAKGGTALWLIQRAIPPQIFCFIFIVSFMRARRVEKAARRSCQSIYHLCSDLGVENAGHAAGARAGLLIVLRPMERACYGRAGWVIDRFAPNGARSPRRAASRAAAPAGAPAACGA